MDIHIPQSWKKLLNKNAMLFFASFFWRRVKQEQIGVIAGYLSFVSVMSLVPILMVIFTVMTAFPVFSDISHQVEEFVFSNFVPASGEVVHEYITSFVINAKKMSTFAISLLVIFAILLISSIDKTINNIWGVNKRRKFATSLAMYWTVLTLGPILLGSSIAVSSYIISLVSRGEYNLFGFADILLRMLPLIASVAFFTFMYSVVPNTQVYIRFAAIGGVFAALLFEIAKKGFAAYVTAIPSYEAIYGALASIPILFLWVYISWFVVLSGAVTTVALQNFDAVIKSKGRSQN
ncbi:virulence factor BrkB family protein [Thalassotalea agarivorans]|uniref:UPF0761 membrane protein SAMN05660429_02951 n=1 Tax=Thalassotalea agarivorans TaxID=349064 RepID=A0A1I0HWX8_THASX|nr:virulence factor BrkB family protein [Thalassotalea agarivorans]SET87884.1 tRNA-processing RNAse BN [Thalassotalea agarivorans]